MSGHVKTSLERRAASGFTAQQIAANTKAAQAKGAKSGVLVIHQDDELMSWPERELVKQLLAKVKQRAEG
jgi:cellobiose-specific phosphotransferase system component IIA